MTKSRAGSYAHRQYGSAPCDICAQVFERSSSRSLVCEPCRPALAALRLKETAEHRAEKSRSAYLANPDRAKAASRNRRAHLKATDHEALKKQQREYRQAWRDRNPEKSRAYKAQWMRAKRKEPRANLNTRIGNGIRASLASGKGGQQWNEAVGYSTDDLMRHIERQFLAGMSWANMPEWHVDHILPLSSFEFETVDCPGFKAAWAMTNLRPMWAFDNISKGAKVLVLI